MKCKGNGTFEEKENSSRANKIEQRQDEIEMKFNEFNDRLK